MADLQGHWLAWLCPVDTVSTTLMPPTSMKAARSASARLLNQIAVVYTESPSNGRYDVVLYPSLACRLVQPITVSIATLPMADRAELMAGRDFWWDPSVELSEQCQVEIDGVRWQLRPGTFQATKPDGTTVVSRRCMAARIQVASF